MSLLRCIPLDLHKVLLGGTVLHRTAHPRQADRREIAKIKGSLARVHIGHVRLVAYCPPRFLRRRARPSPLQYPYMSGVFFAFRRAVGERISRRRIKRPHPDMVTRSLGTITQSEKCDARRRVPTLEPIRLSPLKSMDPNAVTSIGDGRYSAHQLWVTAHAASTKRRVMRP